VDCVTGTSNEGKKSKLLLLIGKFSAHKYMTRNVKDVKAVFLPPTHNFTASGLGYNPCFKSALHLTASATNVGQIFSGS
jgi:hypothetical protein